MTCPFCLYVFRRHESVCGICRHELRPEWTRVPPHELPPGIRLELVVADCRHVLGSLAAVYRHLADGHPGSGWLDMHLEARRDCIWVPLRLEGWISGLDPIPDDVEELACGQVEHGIWPVTGALVPELRKSSQRRLRAVELSRNGSDLRQVAELQADIVRGTWWGLYGSPLERQNVLTGVLGGGGPLG